MIPGGLRILIVEDSLDIRDALLVLLHQADLIKHVEWAPSVPEANRIMAASTERFDVAIIDLHLAKGFGISVIKALRASAVHNGAFVLVATNHTLPAYRQASLDAGANVFLDKSKAFDQIVPLIKQRLQN